MNRYKIQIPSGDDIPELVSMFEDLLHHAYPNREIAPRLVLYSTVTRWFNGNDRLRIATKDELIVGFSLVRPNDAGGVTETVLDADITYVKPEFRKTRAAFLIYNDIYDFADRSNMTIMSTSTVESSPIVAKRFGAKITFNHFETTKTKSS